MPPTNQSDRGLPQAIGKSQIRVLLSAYACEPGKGSEPGVGWKWTRGLSERVELTVLTRSNNRESILREVAASPDNDPLRQVRFLYHDLGVFWKFLKHRRLLPTMAYYFLWQWTAARRFRNEAKAADIVHHLTFCSSLCPGFWGGANQRLAIGPTAAPLVNRHYLPLFGLKAPIQAFRNAVVRHSFHLPWLGDTFRKAAIVVPANSETQSLFRATGIPTRDIMLDTGAPEEPQGSAENTRVPCNAGTSESVFLYAGVIERRKGLEMVLRAFAEFQNHSRDLSARLIVLGKGPDLPRLRKLANSLGIGDRVEFPGSVPHDQVNDYFRKAVAFVFASVRDASGGVNLEAMASGLPLICIAHQGVGDISDPTCAERIPPGPVSETILALSEAINRCARDPERVTAMGFAAKQRARDHFNWASKFDTMLRHYEDSMNLR
jgi:glycosyltransferase involved in cell wall biosynthesis